MLIEFRRSHNAIIRINTGYFRHKVNQLLTSMTRTNYHYVSRRINFHPARRRKEAMRWHR